MKAVNLTLCVLMILFGSYLNARILPCSARARQQPCYSMAKNYSNTQLTDARKYGLNPLQYATLIGDLETMSELFDELQRKYGNNPQQLFAALNARNKAGLNILGLAELNANRRVVELVLMRVSEILGNKKELFFKFINTGDHARGWTPLMDAIFDSESNNLNLMVKIAVHVLGRDSELFKQFINMQDKEGDTALLVAQKNVDQFFLLRYGAKDENVEKSVDRDLVKAQKFGFKLIEAVEHSNLVAFKQIMRRAVKEFGDQAHLFYHMLSTRDEAGWNPIIHAAAHGQMETMKMMLHEIEEHFPEDEKELRIKVLSNNDYEGRTALHLALSRRYHKIAQLLMEKLIDYSENKPYLFTVLNAPDELNGYTPLMYVVYGAFEYDRPAYDFLKDMLATMADVFGRDSRMFELFINARDYNGQTPLAYVSDDKMRELLTSYGAIDEPIKKIRGVGDFDGLEIHGEL